MKPTECFDRHVDGVGQIVSLAKMTNLMRYNCLQLLRREPLPDSFGQQ
jgi:hypothetical protein